MTACPFGCGSIVPLRNLRAAGGRVIVCPACLAVGAAGEAFLDPRRSIDLTSGIRRAIVRVRDEGEIDPVTGLLTPASFLARFSRVLAEARHRYFVSVAAVRIVAQDGINDELMREISAEIRSALREGDEIGRIELDLLGIVIRGADRGAAEALAERAVSRVEKRIGEKGIEVRLERSVASSEGQNAEASWLLALGGLSS